ncbi:MAG: P1 family peptidase [Lachnospiraceae bacterium]
MEGFQQIKVSEIPNIHVGQVENKEAATGVTVFLADNADGFAAGVSVRGGGPAARESQLLAPKAAAQTIHALVLGGGSAFGLDAAGGVMKYLEEHDIGFDVGVTKVPLVCQSDLFDLTVGDFHVRPDADMGYRACAAAMEGNYKDGNYGAGCGATVGKFMDMEYCMKSGIGSYVVRKGDLIIGAVVAVNALGDIYDYRTNEKLAGLLNEDKNGFRNTTELMYESYTPVENRFVENTTIGAVITNAAFDKTQLCKIADMAHNGYARSIKPLHTSADGDTIYALSVGSVQADGDMIGTLAADVMSEAIMKAVKSAESAYGYPSYTELQNRK